MELNCLFLRIQSDQVRRARNNVEEPLSFSTFNFNRGHQRSTSELNGEFVHLQVLIDHLLRLNSNCGDQKRLVLSCMKEYSRNDAQLAVIKEFEQNYSMESSLLWYTRDSFVYRMLNQALRTQNVNLLLLFRFVIGDLLKRLEEHRCQSPISTYRGQLMSKSEVEVLKQSVGELISFNSFLSTSVDRVLALFLLTDASPSDDLERVLFEIEADPRLPGTKPFADITFLSSFPDEQETLFMLGSIFRMRSLSLDDDGIWIVRLTLCSELDHDLKPIINYLKTRYIEKETNLLSLGNLLLDMGRYDEAEKYFRRFINNTSLDDPNLSAFCLHLLGMVDMKRGDHELSLRWFNKSLNIKMQHQIRDDDLAHTLNAMAIVYADTDDLPRARRTFQDALSIFQEQLAEDHLTVAMCLRNIGSICAREEKFDEALDYLERSLIMTEKHVHPDYPTLSEIHNSIGQVQKELGHYDLALKHFNAALRIEKKSCPRPETVAGTLTNIADVHREETNFKEALSFYEKAALIDRQTLPLAHSDVTEIEENIKDVLSPLS